MNDTHTDAALRRPLIAITPDCHRDEAQPTEASYLLRMNYASALSECGALPIILTYDQGQIGDVVERFDGFLISGTTPGTFEVGGRYEYERALISSALAAAKPVLGICNGMQMLGLALGGTLVDQIAPEHELTHLPRAIPDAVAHEVHIAPESRLSLLAGRNTSFVNSFHRQAIDRSGTYLVAATAPDGTVEAIEGLEGAFTFGAQWHPEYLLSAFDRRLLAEFVAAARAGS